MPESVTVQARGTERTFDRAYILDRVRVSSSGCWEWQGLINSGGRAIAAWNKGGAYAYRVSYMLFVGPIPEGLLICHHCDNPSCVRPSHLYAGTQLENMRDAVARGRTRAPKAPTGLAQHDATVPPEVIAAAVEAYLNGGVSQAEMAVQLGVAQSTFGRWVRGTSRRDSGLAGVSIGKGRKVSS